MPEIEGVPAKPKDTEEEVRAILRDHVQKLMDVLLTPECHNIIEREIEHLTELLDVLRGEARRKNRSKAYIKLCEGMVAKAATSEIGPLASLADADRTAFQEVLDTIVVGLADKSPAVERIDPAAFVSFQKKLLVPRKKRGPRDEPIYDDASA